jgi:hypothetical protein
MIFLGLDPGTSDNMAVAALLPDLTIRVALARGADGKDPRDRAPGLKAELFLALASLGLPRGTPGILALEWQQNRPGDPRPQNIIDLSAFAGIALAIVQVQFGSTPLEVFTPFPSDWKGQVPKHVKHNRIVALASIARVRSALQAADIPCPKDLGVFTKTFSGKASDAIDAIGLALWARDKAALRATVRRAILRSQ